MDVLKVKKKHVIYLFFWSLFEEEQRDSLINDWGIHGCSKNK